MDSIRKFYHDIIKVWANEIRLIFKDKGILIFLFLLPLAYPIVYALIYNPELAREVPVAVVDECRSTQSRELVRMMDASENTQLAGYAADMQEARRMVAEKKAYGILLIDSHFSKNIARGEQAHVTLFCDMSLLVRYKSMLTSLTDATMTLGGKIQVETIGRLGADGPKIPATVRSTYVALGNPEQGFATFLLPGILTLIVQQSLILAICMMGGAIYERRRRNGGIDPLDTVNSGAVCRLLYRHLHHPVALSAFNRARHLQISASGRLYRHPADVDTLHAVGDIPRNGSAGVCARTRERVSGDCVHFDNLPVPVGHHMAAFRHGPVLPLPQRMLSVDMGDTGV